MPRFALVLLAFIFCATTAFAQDAAAPAVATWGDILSYWRDGAAAALATGLSVVAGWFGWKGEKSRKLGDDAKETKEGLDWESLIDRIAKKVFNMAAIKVGITPDKIQSFEDKEGFLGWAMYFLRTHHADVAAWLDKNANGIPDFLERGDANPNVDTNGVRAELEARLFELAPASAFKVPKGATVTVSASAGTDELALGLMHQPQRTFATPRTARDMAHTFKPKNKRPV